MGFLCSCLIPSTISYFKVCLFIFVCVRKIDSSIHRVEKPNEFKTWRRFYITGILSIKIQKIVEKWGLWVAYQVYEKSIKFGAFKKLKGINDVETNIEITSDDDIKKAINEYWEEVTVRSENPNQWTKKPIFYAPSVPGSLFPDNVDGFNVNKLRKDVSLIHNLPEDEYLNSIHTPQLYIGRKNSTFGMHAEDWYLSAICYNHTGAPKVWFVIKRDYEKNIMELGNDSIANNTCDNLLYHRCTVISPATLKEANIKYSVVRLFSLFEFFLIFYLRLFNNREILWLYGRMGTMVVLIWE